MAYLGGWDLSPVTGIDVLMSNVGSDATLIRAINLFLNAHFDHFLASQTSFQAVQHIAEIVFRFGVGREGDTKDWNAFMAQIRQLTWR